MKCPECGSENSDSSKFCKSCGSQLTPQKNNIIKVQSDDNGRNKKIIITAIAIVAIILAGIGVYASGILTPDTPLETKDFGMFTIDVPVGSNFVVGDAVTTGSSGGIMSYENKGKYRDEATFLIISTNSSKPDANEYDLIESDGDKEYYACKEPDSTGTCYVCYIKDDKAFFEIIGYNLNTIKNMAKTLKIKHVKDLHSKTTAPSQSQPTTQSQPTQTQNTAPTATAMSILGGSFSTGSGLSDKTYASIYVGPEHAGENVKIQIWYSRDGSTLNNGNMVPKTVDSSGYINVRSADAYSKYPDYAEVNVYDTSGNLLDSVSVTLAPDSGTQNF